jgi:hypothetical protein
VTTEIPRVQRRRLNPWVSMVYDAWRAAHDAWEAEAEHVAIGYDTELREFAATHPRPRLKDFMVHLSYGQQEDAA